MKVFIVTTGQYSDYTIEGVCSTQEIADAVTACYSDVDVKVFEVDADFSKDQVHKYQCFLDGNGNLSSEDSWWDQVSTNRRGGNRLGPAFEMLRYRGWSDVSAEDARRLAAEARTRHLKPCGD